MDLLVNTVWALVVVVQLVFMFFFVWPFLLYLVAAIKKKRYSLHSQHPNEADYAVIVTAYQYMDQVPYVVDSILKTDYENYLIYIVADQCDTAELIFDDERVLLLKPEHRLGNNIKSHFYAIDRFRRNHKRLVIIDSDNLVQKQFFKELNVCFDTGFTAVQGLRVAKNIDSSLAALDEAGDMFYRFIDRKLLFETGSSASLAGSGMAFDTKLYKSCLTNEKSEGAGFDKILQYRILKKDLRIAFAEKAIVYDEKTSKSEQLVKQRARWVNTWFKFFWLGAALAFRSLKHFSYNQFAFSIMMCRPPLFIMLFFAILGVVVNVLIASVPMIVGWVIAFSCFIYLFFTATRYFNASTAIYRAITMIPSFCFYQFLALLNVRRANRVSVATQHTKKKAIEEVEQHVEGK